MYCTKTDNVQNPDITNANKGELPIIELNTITKNCWQRTI